MANKWNLKHGFDIAQIYPHYEISYTIDAPDDDAVGNVVYVDPNNPNSSDSADNAGCANVPYLTYEQAITDVKSRYVVFAQCDITTDTAPSKFYFFADTPFASTLRGNGLVAWASFYGVNSIGFFRSQGSSYGGDTYSAILDTPGNSGGYNEDAKYSVVLNATVSNKPFRFFNSLIINQNFSEEAKYSMVYNSVGNIESLTDISYSTFWLGALNYNTLTSDLTDICTHIDVGTITEAEGIAQVETDLELNSGELSGIGFRLLNPHFVDADNGNFNIDFLNYDCSEILAVRDEYEWPIGRGISVSFPTNFVGGVGAGFGFEPDSEDGFLGALFSRNIDSSGAIVDTALDTMIVSEEFDLGAEFVVEKLNYFGKLLEDALVFNADVIDGTDTPSLFTFYMFGVRTGNTADYFNSANFSFSYENGVLTTDLPKFIYNTETQCNRTDNVILGQLDNGTCDLDAGRNIYNAAFRKFRFIAVKKGV